MINYQKEIDKKRLEIEELQKKMNDYLIDKYPNIVGRTYRVSPSIYYKIKSIDHVFDDKRSNCTVIRVIYSDEIDTQLSVGSLANITIDHTDGSKILEEEFNIVFEKAIQKIKKLK